MKKCPFCQQEIQDEAVKCRYCAELLVHEPELSVGDGSLNFPNTSIGFILGGSFFVLEMLLFMFHGQGAKTILALGMLLISLAGFIYWFVCLYKLHKVLAVMAGDCYPISPARAVGFGFIPFYNLYWIFKWPGEIIRFVRARSGIRTWETWIPGLALLGSILARNIDGTIWFLLVFGVLSYLVHLLKQSLIAAPAATPYKSKMTGSSAATVAIVCVCMVPVIVLLAAIAIPNLLRARITANEAAVRSDLRTFLSAAESFRAAQIPPTYPANFASLAAPASGSAYLDASWLSADRSKHGYRLSFQSRPSTFSVLAVPVAKHSTAVNSYCIDQKGILVASVNGVGSPAATSEGCSGGSPVSGSA